MKPVYLGAAVLSASLAWQVPAWAADRTEITFPGESRLSREPHRDVGRHDLCRQSL